MSLRLQNLTRFWVVHTNVRRQVGSDRRAATLQEGEDHHYICAAAVNVSQMDRDDGEHRQNPTAADVVLWLGSDPAGSDYAGTPTDPEAPTLFERLSASQREFAVVVLGSAPDPYYLSGRAGFGKSRVARYLVHAFRSVGKLVAVTGTTATAASNIGGVTLHRFLKLSKGFESSLEPSHAMWPVLKTISVVIVDEISTATAHLLSALDHVLRRAHLPDCKRLPFGGRTIIAIGDLCQLPPVPPRRFGVVYNNCAVYVLGLWGKFRMHELRESFRQQDDPELQMCLDELHDGMDDGQAWDILLQRIVGIQGNDALEFTAKDDIVNAAATTPCIAPYKRANPDTGDTVPQCHEINNDHLLALGEDTEACRMVHAQAFVAANGKKLKRTGGRLPIVLEYADLPGVIVLHKGLKVRVRRSYKLNALTKLIKT